MFGGGKTRERAGSVERTQSQPEARVTGVGNEQDLRNT
jgi:hypothetical protein